MRILAMRERSLSQYSTTTDKNTRIIKVILMLIRIKLGKTLAAKHLLLEMMWKKKLRMPVQRLEKEWRKQEMLLEMGLKQWVQLSRMEPQLLLKGQKMLVLILEVQYRAFSKELGMGWTISENEWSEWLLLWPNFCLKIISKNIQY